MKQNNKELWLSQQEQKTDKHELEKIWCPDDRQILTVHSSLGIMYRHAS